MRKQASEDIINTPGMMRPAQVRAASFDETNNTIEVIWTTGATVRRCTWADGSYDEELVVGADNVRLDRLNAGAPFLNSHNGYDLEGMLGAVVPNSARIEGGMGLAKIQLSRREDVAGIVQDIRDGVIRNVSVGYRYHKIEKTEADDGTMPLWRVVDWEPIELSAVPIPADPGAQMRGAQRKSPELFPCLITRTVASPIIVPRHVLASRRRMRMLELELAA